MIIWRDKSIKIIIGIIVSAFGIFPVYSQLNWNWVKAGNSGHVEIADMARDGFDNIYIAGSYNWSITVDGNEFNGERFEVLLMKYDKDYNLLWVKSFGTNEADFVTDILIDNVNNLYLSGSINETGSTSIWKIDPEGNILWAKDLGNSPNRKNSLYLKNDKLILTEGSNFFVINSEGELIVESPHGYYSHGSTQDGRDWVISNYGLNIGRFDENFELISELSIALNQTGKIKGIIVSDNIYLIGEYYQLITFNDEITLSSGDYSIASYVAKFDLQGNFLWVSHIENGRSEIDDILHIENELWVTGKAPGSSKFGTFQNYFTGDKAFVARMDTETGHFKDLLTGGSTNAQGKAFCVLSDNRILLAGKTSINEFSEAIFGEYVFNNVEPITPFFLAEIGTQGLNISFEGVVRYNDNPMPAPIYVYDVKGNGVSQLVNKSITDDSGYYKVLLYSKGNFVLRAGYSNDERVITYYPSQFLWGNSTLFNVSSDSSFSGINIDLISTTKLSGNSTISGNIIDGNDNPKRFIDVFLTDNKNNLLSYSLADTLGNYLFDSIPDGTFRVYIDTTGVTNSSYHQLNVISNGRSEDDFLDYNFRIHNGTVEAINGIVTSSSYNLDNKLYLYPNPAKNIIYVKGTEYQKFNFRIVNLQGKEIKTGKLYNNSINVENIKPGLYVLYLESKRNIISKRFAIMN